MYGRNFFTKTVVLLCFGLFLLAFCCAADAQTAPQIAGKAFESTVLLVMEDANGQPISLGSGFLVREGEIASNLHVIKGASRGYAKLVSQKDKYDIQGITGIDTDRDLVLLKISPVGTLGGNTQKQVDVTKLSDSELEKLANTPPLSLSLGNSDTVQVGETVYAVGNPQGLEGTFSQGIVSSIRQVGSDKVLQITAPISPGSSGGPVLNSKGEVIGVSVATFRGGQNLNFAIPSNYLKALIARSGPPKPFSGIKPSAKQRSLLADLGGRSTEGVLGANLTYDSSSLPDGSYSFSLVNKLREPVRNVFCLIVFYDVQGAPLDVAMVHYEGVIPGGLAKRVTGHVVESVEKLNNPTPAFPYVPAPPRRPKGKINFRILDFQLAE
jgi:V8-like Glu-specific endopeptidase